MSTLIRDGNCQIETFQDDEIADEAESPGADSERANLVQVLGLEGQTEFAKKAVVAFPVITKEQNFVYRVLCPESTDITKYSHGPIPLRVLHLANSAKNSGHFDALYVGYDPQSKDPVVVGVHRDGWREIVHVIARWGDHLDEWPALVNRALERWQAIAKTSIAKAKARLEGDERALAGVATLQGTVELTGGVPAGVSYNSF